jgi:hypothetical protein
LPELRIRPEQIKTLTVTVTVTVTVLISISTLFSMGSPSVAAWPNQGLTARRACPTLALAFALYDNQLINL